WILSDQREGQRLGLAIANDTNGEQTATISVYDPQGGLLKSAARPVAARSSISGFLDELTGYSGTTLTQILVTCGTGCTAIGLRFADVVFTTIPAMVNSSMPLASPPPPASLCTDTPSAPSGTKPFNQTQTEKLCGNWRF